MAGIVLDVWLYGTLSHYGGRKGDGSFANLRIRLPERSTVAKLLSRLKLPTGQRGITFINGQLSAMPGLQPDLSHILHDGDRVAFFDPKSMWPFQYRHGAALTDEMEHAMISERDHGLHHTYGKSLLKSPSAPSPTPKNVPGHRRIVHKALRFHSDHTSS